MVVVFEDACVDGAGGIFWVEYFHFSGSDDDEEKSGDDDEISEVFSEKKIF